MVYGSDHHSSHEDGQSTLYTTQFRVITPVENDTKRREILNRNIMTLAEMRRASRRKSIVAASCSFTSFPIVSMATVIRCEDYG